MLGLVFALVVVAAGLLVAGRQRHLAAVLGLGLAPPVCVWLGVAGVPPWLRGLVVLALATGGILVSKPALSRSLTTGLLLVAVLLPAVLLSVAFAGIEVPVSAHDGAFHVETIDALRQGLDSVSTWYPSGFHSTIAALLALTPWLDSARGTLDLTQGLTILAPLCVFGLGIALGLRPVAAAVAAVIVAVTFLYPYDYHLWGGWPLGTGVMLALGVWSLALTWLSDPRLRWAALAGLLVGSIVLTHGTEVYTAALGLLVIAALRLRYLNAKLLAPHAAVAGVISLIVAAPYLPTVLGWVSSGGASSVGAEILDFGATNPDVMGRGDLLQYALGITGASGPLDLPIRVALLALGLWGRPPRVLLGLWLTFAVLLLVLDFTSFDWFNRVFVMTFPWLVDHRPRQIAVLLASLIEAIGVLVGVGYLAAWRARWTHRPHAWRRTALAAAVLVGFFAEGSAVGVYKRLTQSVSEQALYSVDDNAAMAWLRQHARPGEVLANDRAADAGIWAPYKAGVPILLPRSGASDAALRETILVHLADLDAAPQAQAAACSLRVRYLYEGAVDSPYDESMLPPREQLVSSGDFEEVFRSGPAAIFRIRLPCPVP
jgi:hypothetical protein